MLFCVNLVIMKINYFAPAIKRSPLSLFLDHFFVVGRGGGRGIKGTALLHLGKDVSLPFINHDPCDLRSLINPDLDHSK